nr:thiamine-phosphate kinase [Desulfuromonadales bacterium]
MKLADIGEFGLIERIRQRASGDEDLPLGIGDDCSVAQLPAGRQLLTTTDMLLEDVHFRRAWTDLRTLGRKCVAVNVSDIAAMGGCPRHVYVGLALPDSLQLEEIDALLDGLLEGCQRYGATLAGGDTCRSHSGLVVSVTVQGHIAAGRAVTRGGAGVDELVCVSGTLGDSALALADLMHDRPVDRWLLGRHLEPQARVGLGRALADQGLATAMIDLSDGLLADLGHILESSEVGARIDLSDLPLSPAFRRRAGDDRALHDLALCGGEDYELLFTAAERHWPLVQQLAESTATPVSRIGRITDRRDLAILDAAGRPYRPSGSGFDHFPGA